MTRSKIRLGILIAVGLLITLFFVRARIQMPDFEVNYQAGHRLAMGETLYRPSDSHWQFKYSPFSACLYLPLSFLPLAVAKGVWFFVVLASMGVLAVLTTRLAAPPPGHAVGPAVWGALILAKFLLRELQLGQINALIAALLMIMIWRLDQDNASSSPGRSWLEGGLWGVAAALKPYALIFLPYFIIKRKGRLLAAAALTLVLTLVLPAGFYGIRGGLTVVGEWGTTLSQSTPPLFASQDNVSLMGFFTKWTGNLPLAYAMASLVIALLAVLTLVLILRGKRLSRPGFLEGALLLLLIPLVSPLGWDYTFLSSYPAVVLILAKWKTFSPRARIFLAGNFAIIGLSLYDLLGRKIYARFMSWSVLTVSFLVVAVAVAALRWKEQA
jgi:alpha-1,2-mannosyltransferase